MGSTQLNTFVYFKMYKTGSGIGAMSSSTNFTQPVIPCFHMVWSHTRTYIYAVRTLFFSLCDKNYLL